MRPSEEEATIGGGGATHPCQRRRRLRSLGGREARPPLPTPLAQSKGEDVGRVGGRENVRKGKLCGVSYVERND